MRRPVSGVEQLPEPAVELRVLKWIGEQEFVIVTLLQKLPTFTTSTWPVLWEQGKTNCTPVALSTIPRSFVSGNSFVIRV